MCKIYFSKLRISVEVICNLDEIRRSVALLKFKGIREKEHQT